MGDHQGKEGVETKQPEFCREAPFAQPVGGFKGSQGVLRGSTRSLGGCQYDTPTNGSAHSYLSRHPKHMEGICAFLQEHDRNPNRPGYRLGKGQEKEREGLSSYRKELELFQLENFRTLLANGRLISHLCSMLFRELRGRETFLSFFLSSSFSLSVFLSQPNSASLLHEDAVGSGIRPW